MKCACFCIKHDIKYFFLKALAWYINKSVKTWEQGSYWQKYIVNNYSDVFHYFDGVTDIQAEKYNKVK